MNEKTLRKLQMMKEDPDMGVQLTASELTDVLISVFEGIEKTDKALQEGDLKGDQGEKGEKGDTGEQGPEGPQGPAGSDGKDGRDGKDATITTDMLEKTAERALQMADLPDFAEITAKQPQIIKEVVKEMEKKYTVEDIDGLEEALENIKRNTQQQGGVSRNWVKQYVSENTGGDGSGDVVGPSEAVDTNFASFDGTTGKLLQDSAKKATDFAPALGADDNYVTDAEKVVIGNTSGINTGDQDISGIATNASAISDLETGKQDILLEGAFVNGDKTKLDGIATGATANDTDANLKNRANHTGTQTVSTISDFDTEISNNTDVSANTSARHAESHTVASHSDTTATGAELNELTDGSETTLHSHAGGGSSPLTAKGDLYTYDTDDARLPIGTDDQILVADSTESTGMKWADFADGYAYFNIWAEESSTTGAGTYEWSYGNGDEAASGGGAITPVACELYALSTTASSTNTGFSFNLKKNGSTVATSDVQGANQAELTTLGSPISFASGDVMDFQTATAGASSAGTRVFAHFRVAVKGQKGDTGVAGADGDISWQGEWSAGTYYQNDAVENNGSSYVCTATDTTEQPTGSATDWDLVAEKGDTGPEGGTKPYAHLIPSSTQNMGGANGTVHYVDWDGTAINVDTGFTHSTSTNPSRIQVDADGRYEIKANVAVTQGGSARTTYMSGLRVNGTTAHIRGRQRNYSRGSGYGDTSTGLNTEIDLTNGDYIEMSITIDDADGTYTSNMINAESEFIIRKIA